MMGFGGRKGKRRNDAIYYNLKNKHKHFLKHLGRGDFTGYMLMHVVTCSFFN